MMIAVAAAPLPTQDWVDLGRYVGRWYEIARLPNRFQEQCAGDVAATYTLREDGRVSVVNECRRKDGRIARAEGVARTADENGPASRLKVRFAPAWLSFLGLVWGDYWIVELDSDYRYAVVGDPSRKYLWILSRRPELDAATYDSLVASVARLGFDVSRLKRTAQSAGDAPATDARGRD
ncbi:MAG TPA: lipocalin family protein [Vicinamibacteria bacterium]|nr:lipocalin family protein [Vicinamibacteria bacterium]